MRRDLFKTLMGEWPSAFWSKPSCGFAEKITESGLFNTEDDVIENFDTLCDMVGTWLDEHGYTRARALMDFNLRFNEGKTRKDGKTPAALHEVTQSIFSIACYEAGLKFGNHQAVMCTIFSHDMGENFNIRPQQMGDFLFIQKIGRDAFTLEFLENFNAISKKYGKEMQYDSDEEYMAMLRTMEHASAAKLFDNLHNLMTLIGGLKHEKGSGYIHKIENQLTEHVDALCENFPHQTETYRTLESAIRVAIAINRSYYDGDVLDSEEALHKAMPKVFHSLPPGLTPHTVPLRRITRAEPQQEDSKNPDDNLVLIQ